MVSLAGKLLNFSQENAITKEPKAVRKKEVFKKKTRPESIRSNRIMKIFTL